MKNLRLVGGPSPYNIRLIDVDTGETIPGVTRVLLEIAPGEIVKAEVSLIVDVDMELDSDTVTVSELVSIPRWREAVEAR